MLPDIKIDTKNYRPSQYVGIVCDGTIEMDGGKEDGA